MVTKERVFFLFLFSLPLLCRNVFHAGVPFICVIVTRLHTAISRKVVEKKSTKVHATRPKGSMGRSRATASAEYY